MGQNFSRLRERIEEIFKNGGNPDALQDSDPVKKYWQWLKYTDPTKHRLTSAASRTQRDRKSLLVHPFFDDFDADSPVLVVISLRAGNFINSNSLKSVLGVKSTATNYTFAPQGFLPARVQVREVSTPSDRTSRITGRSYKTKHQAADKGYVLPFGQLAANQTIGERFTAIQAAFAASSDTAVKNMSIAVLEEQVPTGDDFFSLT